MSDQSTNGHCASGHCAYDHCMSGHCMNGHCMSGHCMSDHFVSGHCVPPNPESSWFRAQLSNSGYIYQPTQTPSQLATNILFTVPTGAPLRHENIVGLEVKVVARNSCHRGRELNSPYNLCHPPVHHLTPPPPIHLPPVLPGLAMKQAPTSAITS